MFKALVDMLDVPISVKPFMSMDGAGDKVHGPAYNAMCSPEHKATTVRTITGEQVVSDTTLYIDGRYLLDHKDIIVFEGRDYFIKAVHAYYENGSPSILVVYI